MELVHEYLMAPVSRVCTLVPHGTSLTGVQVQATREKRERKRRNYASGVSTPSINQKKWIILVGQVAR